MMFKARLRAAADKAQRVMGALGRMMPNVGGPSKTEGVMHSVLLYGAPTWALS